MSIKPSATATLVASAFLIVACEGDEPITTVASGTVISNVTVVNTRDGTSQANMAVVIDNAKIQKIDRASNIRVEGTAQSIDASGKYVVPGFNDMHTHTLDAADLTPTYWPLLIANGITGVREMRGSADLVRRAQKLNADSAAGLVDAPEVLLVPGEIIGQIPAPATVAIATSAPAAVAEVQKQKAYAAGFVKMFNVNREASLAILAEAKNRGLTVAGHLSPALGAVESSNAGWKAIEHLGSGIGILLDCATEEAAVRAALLRGEGSAPSPLPPTWSANALSAPFYQRVSASYDNAKCQAVAQTFAKNETWNVPTLIRLRTTHFVDDALYRTDPNLIYVSKATRAAWEAAAVQRSTLPATAAATFRQYYALQQTLPKLLKQNGARLLAGSDTATQANWVIPGFSLHQEFRLLAASGLSPLEILQMTTLNGAQFLQREATMGTVDEGKNADLVLLDANPVADVENLGKIAAVFLKGRYFSKAMLDKLKSDVAKTYESRPLAAPSTAAEPAHVD